ncbi:MAG: transcriptional repressor [Proteobacteria bacterium]|nr:transcriptional repressor [Pseudomonadota bacterium]
MASIPPLALVEKIRRGLGPRNARRVGLHHAQLLQTLLEMENAQPDARDIYRALLAARRGMIMASLYRGLRVLEDAGLVRREHKLEGGRPRSVYRVVERVAATQEGGPAAAAPRTNAER